MMGTEEHSKPKKKWKIPSNWFRYHVFQYLCCCHAVMQLFSAFNNALFHWYNIIAAGTWNCCVFLWGKLIVLGCSASNADVLRSKSILLKTWGHISPLFASLYIAYSVLFRLFQTLSRRICYILIDLIIVLRGLFLPPLRVFFVLLP